MEDGAGDLDGLQLWVRQARETAGRQALADSGVALQVASSLPGIVASWETSRSVHERRLLLSLRALMISPHQWRPSVTYCGLPSHSPLASIRSP